jgi:hypothetical protein
MWGELARQDVSNRKRVVLHAGLSKCGSTSIQWQLQEDATRLRDKAVAVVTDWFPASASAISMLPMQDWRWHLPPWPEGASTSLARTYEQYKLRRRSSQDQAQDLLDRLGDLVLEALVDADVVVLSAEAFETSLALRDTLFRDFLGRLCEQVEVSVVVYVPQPAEHAVSSWQEWAWYEGFRLFEWLALYVREHRGTDFWRRAAEDYWAELWALDVWLPWWEAELPGVMDLRLRAGLAGRDVVQDFFGDVLGVSPAPSAVRMNTSWPAWAYPVMPLLAPTFRSDYARFDAVRREVQQMSPESLGLPPRGVTELIDAVNQVLLDYAGPRLRRGELAARLPPGSLGDLELRGSAGSRARALHAWDAVGNDVGSVALQGLIEQLLP